MRWIVGDLQGCAREFEDLLATVRFDRSRDEMWAVGDLVNRGPDSLRTLEIWWDVGGRSVIGNHEVYALLAHRQVWPRKPDTLSELFEAAEADTWLSRLRALPLLVHLPRGQASREVWIVHGGLDPRWSDLHELAARVEARPHDDDWLTSDEVSFATRVRCCTREGERSRYDREPEGCPPPYRPWDQFYTERATADAPRIVHGHWAWRGAYRSEHVIGLDSGCVYGRGLTAWCVEEDRLVVVPSR